MVGLTDGAEKIFNIDDLAVVGGFIGSNPQDLHNIVSMGDRSFIITPECEAASPAYKFRLDINVINFTDETKEVSLRVDWHEETYHFLRSILYVSSENCKQDWKTYTGQTAGNGSYGFTIPIPSGVSRISASPRYLNSDVLSLKSLCSEVPELSIREYLLPDLIEPVNVFYVQKNSKIKRPMLFATARCHPYETAGSFCLDGVLRELATNSSYRESLLERFDICLIPLLATNGVAVGNCQMNGVGSPGIDISREWSERDALCQVVKEVVNGYTITGYMEFHNWMHPDIDGIKYANRLFTWKYLNRLQALGTDTMRFRKKFKYWVFPSETYGILRMIKDSFGAVILALEYPWNNRTCGQMRELGAKSVLAFSTVI